MNGLNLASVKRLGDAKLEFARGDDSAQPEGQRETRHAAKLAMGSLRSTGPTRYGATRVLRLERRTHSAGEYMISASGVMDVARSGLKSGYRYTVRRSKISALVVSLMTEPRSSWSSDAATCSSHERSDMGQSFLDLVALSAAHPGFCNGTQRVKSPLRRPLAGDLLLSGIGAINNNHGALPDLTAIVTLPATLNQPASLVTRKIRHPSKQQGRHDVPIARLVRKLIHESRH